MYAPAGVKTNHNEFPIPERMRAWVLGDPGKAVECRREHDGIEMVPVSRNVRRGPRNSGLDAGLQLFGRGGCGAR